ncbi:MAG: hypothetical protein QXQ02_01740 [Halobacteria archaeon]
MQPQVQCLCTVVKNTSPNTIWILLPKNGTTLSPDEQFVFIGGLDNWLQQMKYRSRDAILKALTTDVIDIVQLPAPHLVNAAGTRKMVVLDATGANVTVADPCWE